MSDWRTNPGRRPGETKGKRVMVKLRNGMQPKESWPADGRGECNWALSNPPSAFDIIEYRIV